MPHLALERHFKLEDPFALMVAIYPTTVHLQSDNCNQTVFQPEKLIWLLRQVFGSKSMRLQLTCPRVVIDHRHEQVDVCQQVALQDGFGVPPDSHLLISL